MVTSLGLLYALGFSLQVAAARSGLGASASGGPHGVVATLLWILMVLMFPAVGAVIARRQPWNAVVADQWLWVPAIGLAATFMLLLFPDGRLVSRRWRPVAWLAAAAMAMAIAATMFTPAS